MSKRSPGQFARRDRDFYPTPYAAVPPLIPHLRGVRTFAEPCAGAGDLVRHLESHGLCCGYAGDIATGQDALVLGTCGDIDAIITNPPWKRPILHLLIAHFAKIAPTWLLLDQDWAATKQATPFLGCCSDILAIGRVRWIAGTKNTGKDNAAWYRFDAHHAAGPAYHAYRSAPTRAVLCRQCGKPYLPQRSDSRTCSSACRQRAWREQHRRKDDRSAIKCNAAVTAGVPKL
jgi:hypothetical protein